MWLVIFALSAAAQPACLQLSLTVPKQRILVGEATKVIVTLRAVCHVDMPRGRPGLLLDDGTGYRQFLDVDEVDESLVIEGKRRLRAGSSCRSSFRMAVPAHFSTDPPELQPGPPFAFPKAGNYQVQAYWPGLRSNVVSVIVVEPQGEDARAWEDLRNARSERS